MTLQLRLISWLTSPLLLTLIPSLLPIPSYPLYTTAQAQTSQDRKTEADKLLNQGIQQAQHSQYQAAIQSWQQALAIYQQLKDRNGEAKSLNNLGIAYRSLGKYQKAIEFHKQSLSIFRQIGNLNGEASPLENLGSAYYSLGQYQNAIDFYQQSLSIFQKIGNRNGEANSLMNLGSAYYSLDQYQKAIDFYQQSLSIFQKIGDSPKEMLYLRVGEAKSLNNLGGAYYSLGQYQNAINFYQQSLTIKRQIGDRNAEANSLMNLGTAYFDLGQHQTAINFYQQSLSIFQKIGNRNGEANSLSNIGNLLEKQQQSELAIVFHKQAVNLRENIRQDLRKLPREQQASYTQTVASTYRSLASLLLQKNRVMEALQILDLLKVQELQDYVRNVQGNERTVKGIELFPQEQKIIQDYTAIQAPIIGLGTKLADLRKLQTRTPTQQQRIQEIEKIQAQTNQQMSEFLKSPAVVALSQQIQQTAPQQNLTLSAYKELQTRLNRLGKRIALFYTLVLDECDI